MDAASKIDVSSTSNGSAGTVFLRPADTGAVQGEIDANGGPSGGAGGSVEISGGDMPDLAGLEVNVNGIAGAGRLLISGYNPTIDDTNVAVFTHVLDQGNGATVIFQGGPISVNADIVRLPEAQQISTY